MASATAVSSSAQVPASVIIPPPEIRTIVDKTADFAARNGVQFEDKIRNKERSNPKFAFLQPLDPYHVYYQWKLSALREARQAAASLSATDSSSTSATTIAAAAQSERAATTTTSSSSTSSTATATAAEVNSAAGESNEKKRPPPAANESARHGTDHETLQAVPHEKESTLLAPPPAPLLFDFTTDPPPIAPLDYDIIKLTALFTAVNGRHFMNQLAVRETHSSVFAFLKASHAFFPTFTRLVEQYQRLLKPPTSPTSSSNDVKKNDPTESKLSKQTLIARIQQRAAHARWLETQRRLAAEEDERERAAIAAIDWNDFVVVDTIDLGPSDYEAALPAPTTLLEVQCTAIEQRRANLALAALPQSLPNITTSRPDDGNITVTHVTAKLLSNEQQENSKTASTSSSLPRQSGKAVAAASTTGISVVPQTAGPIRIKEHVVPRKRRTVDVITQICPRCEQPIPIEEMEEHMRIELLDPRWREQQQSQHRSALAAGFAGAGPLDALSLGAAATMGNQVVRTLRNMAEYRSDIFGHGDEASVRRKIEENKARQREEAKHKVIWDGHTSSIAAAAQRIKESVPLEEQISSIHRTIGLVDDAPESQQFYPAAATASANNPTTTTNSQQQQQQQQHQQQTSR